jgi:hypothetical protein
MRAPAHPGCCISPLVVLFWHAPALVHWHGVSPVKSLFFSAVACMRNAGAMLMYGFAWVALFLSVGFVFSTIGLMLGGPTVAKSIMMPTVLLLVAMFTTSLYFTFSGQLPRGRRRGHGAHRPRGGRHAVTRHLLQGRSESELLWFRRRGFLQAAATWTALGGLAAAHAQQRGNVVELVGEVLLNGQRLRPGQSVQTSDRIETGPDSQLLFVMGNASFLVRQNSRLSMERGATLMSVSVLRLLAGGVVGAWSRGSHRQLVLPGLTAGIRGTGTYASGAREAAATSAIATASSTCPRARSA